MRETCPRSGRLTLLIVAAALVSACAGLPRHVQKTPSWALREQGTTTLGRIVAQDETGENLSGIRLLSSGDEALASLIALADHAERTLDIQYYIIHEDESSAILLHHVRLAADRGVRVRILVDDLNTAGEDRRFLHLGDHANVELRVFNPFPAGRSATWTRWVASASDIRRINHRMHNKLLVADNAVAITGGRNIGDQYFTRDLNSNFIDLDVVAAGHIVPELSASFDEFWNSQYAFPIASIAVRGEPDAPVPPVVTPSVEAPVVAPSVEAPVVASTVAPPSVVAPRVAAPSVVDSALDPDAEWLANELDARQLHLDWVPATVLADQPAKLWSETAPGEEITIANDITALMASAKQELIIISPYFVPGKAGFKLISDLVGRGVHIRILTNSLAATDSPLVHIGYSRYRVGLLKLGVELREVRPKLGQKRVRFHPFRSANASLHAKALVIDQNIVFIGSLNMDARSADTNTELGLVMRSAEIAGEVTELLDDIGTDGSYQLALQDHSDRIEWRSGEPGRKIWYTDPETSRTERLWLKLLSPFAPDELL